MSNYNNIPQLRFSGFTGEWEERKLEKVCNPITPPLKLQSHDYLTEGRFPVVDQSQSLICGYTNDDSGLVTNVPVIIFGDHTCALKYIDFPFVQGADGVKILSPKKGYNPQFVYQAFASNPVKQDGYKRHFSDFKEKTYYFPITSAEQDKIASCLFELDKLVFAQGQKVDALKEKKKGLMQQLFPQPGETTPRLRFPGFTGDWEEKKLGEVFDFRNGYTPSKGEKSYWTNGLIPWFRMDDIRENGHILYDSAQHITESAVKGSRLFNANTIIIATSATIGEHALVKVKHLANQRFVNLEIKSTYQKRTNIDYAYYYMYIVDEICKLNVNIGTFASISNDMLSNIPYLIPSPLEQKKISECLSSLDNNIMAESDKLETLKHHKKGFMQQLFPQPTK